MSYSPRSGRILQSDGTTRNIVDILGGGTPKRMAKLDIQFFAAQGDEIIGEDGNVYSFTELLQSAGGSTSVTWDDVQNKPTEFTPTAHTHAISDITNLSTSLSEKLTATQAAAQADSTAADIAGLVADFNALLAKLRTAGIIAT
jgi:hypothetical protein